MTRGSFDTMATSGEEYQEIIGTNVHKRIDELFSLWAVEECAVDSICKLATSIKSNSRVGLYARTRGETTGSRDPVISLNRKSSPPPRAPSPASPAASPKNSPQPRRRLPANHASDMNPVESATNGVYDAQSPGAARDSEVGLASASTSSVASRIVPSQSKEAGAAIPQFYFPNGRPSKDSRVPSGDIKRIFETLGKGSKGLARAQFTGVCKVSKDS